MFLVLAKKVGAKLRAEDVPDVPQRGDLSGADIEGIIGRAWRTAILAGEERITRPILEETVKGFLPSTQTLERELQEIAAVIECTDRVFLPPKMAQVVAAPGGREKLQERYLSILRVLESM